MRKIQINNREKDLYILHTGHPNKNWLDEFDVKPKVSSNISIIAYSNYKETPALFKQGVDIIKPEGGFHINPDKIDLYNDVLSNIDTEYTLLLDSVDTLILKDLDDTFIEKFEQFDVDVLYCWDRNIYPHFLFIENEPLQYLCAGIVFGKTAAIKQIYKDIGVLKSQYSIEYDYERAEQFWLRLYYNYFNNHNYIIKVDTNMDIFGTIRGYNKKDNNYYYNTTTPERNRRIFSTESLRKYTNQIKLTFLLPTCEPQTIKKYLLPSLKYIKPISDIISFGICFQPPYTQEDIKEILEAFDGFNVKYFEKQYVFTKPDTPLMQMRHECSMLYPDVDYYALLDDDMEFEEGIDNFYLQAITEMNKDKKLSVITFSKRDLFFENKFFTNAGIIYRGGKYYNFEGFVPHKLPEQCTTLVPYDGEDLVSLVGGHQDELCAMIRLACGEKSKSYINVPTKHRENRTRPGFLEHGWLDAEKSANSVNSFIKKYFNSEYSIKSRNLLFDEELKRKVNLKYGYCYELLKEPLILSLNGQKKGSESEHATVRIENYISDRTVIGLDYIFKITKAEDYKEFTILQIHSLDDKSYPVIPIIRFCIIDKALYITYKDNTNTNHYTKIDNFELNKEMKIKVMITPSTIEVNNGKWKYERWCKDFRIRYGLYTQTEHGQYEIEINSIVCYKQKDNWWEREKD